MTPSCQRLCVLLAILLAACARPAPDDQQLCTGLQPIASLPSDVDEASGVAYSRRHSTLLWVHNDSNRKPLLYAFATSGQLIARVALPSSLQQNDWEDIAAGPCPAGHCIYIADIGDNVHDRDDRAILRLAEPDRDVVSVDTFERFPFRYPDSPHDAEALFVLPDTTVFIVTKGRDGPVRVYRYPRPFSPARVTLELVQQLTDGLVQYPDFVTGASASADGRIIAIRSYTHLQLYHFQHDSLVAAGAPIDLAALAEPQGEGVAIDNNGTVILVSENGPEGTAAPFSRMQCRIP